jgi:hypothetical protein
MLTCLKKRKYIQQLTTISCQKMESKKMKKLKNSPPNLKDTDLLSSTTDSLPISEGSKSRRRKDQPLNNHQSRPK